MNYAPNGLFFPRHKSLGAFTGGEIEALAGSGMIAFGAIGVIRKVAGRKKKGAVAGAILDIALIGAGFWLMENSGIPFSQLLTDIGNSSVAQAVGI